MYFSKTEMHTHICCRPIKNGRFWDLASNSSGPPFLPPCTAPSLQDVKQWPEHSSKAFQRNAANIQILTLTKTPNPLFAHNLIGPLEMLELLELATRLGKGASLGKKLPTHALRVALNVGASSALPFVFACWEVRLFSWQKNCQVFSPNCGVFPRGGEATSPFGGFQVNACFSVKTPNLWSLCKEAQGYVPPAKKIWRRS